MIIVGIDPSLTATGIAVLDTEDPLVVQTVTVKSEGHKGDDWPTRHQRLWALVREIEEFPLFPLGGGGRAGLVVVESPSLGQARQGGTLDRAGLFWMLLDRLYAAGFPVALVTPAGRAKYPTGKGTAGKEAVLLAVARRFPHIDVQDNNQADAAVLALMGARGVGEPCDELPKSHTVAVDAVDWPDVWVSRPLLLPAVYRGVSS